MVLPAGALNHGFSSRSGNKNPLKSKGAGKITRPSICGLMAGGVTSAM